MRNTAITRVKAGLLVGMLMGMTAGCGPAAQPADDRVPATLSWCVYTDDFILEEPLSQYTAVSRVFQEKQIRADVVFRPYGSTVEVSRMAASGSLPDLLTFELSDRNAVKLSRNRLLLPVREVSEALYAAVPEPLRRVYADGDGELYGLPGGYGGDPSVPQEGLYVNEAYYRALGEPDMRTVEGFCQALADFCRYAAEEGIAPVIPLAFGKEGSGLETMEHIFGVYPVSRQGGLYYHRIFSENLGRVTDFLTALARRELGAAIWNLDESNFDHLLRTRVLACFAKSGDIEQYNRKNPDERFIAVEPPYAPDGFLEGQAANGRFKTAVSAGCEQRELAAEILMKLYAPETSLELMYGEQDVYWYAENGTQQPILSAQRVLRSDPAAARKSGIGLFPFLSRHGMHNPYIVRTDSRAKDIQAWRYEVNPTDYLASYLRKLDERLRTLYSECLNGERTSRSVLAEVASLRDTDLRAVNAAMPPVQADDPGAS